MILHIIHRVNGHLGALEHILAVNLASVADGLTAAGTDGFQFLNGMGQFQQAGRAREAAHHKVSTQAVADDRDAKILIPYVNFQIIGKTVEERPDLDGENRDIAVEVVLDMDVKAYEERKKDVIADIY